MIYVKISLLITGQKEPSTMVKPGFSFVKVVSVVSAPIVQSEDDRYILIDGWFVQVDLVST